MSQALVALFDLTRATAPLVDFPSEPGVEIHSRGNAVCGRALEALVSAGLASREVMAGAAFYRLNKEARDALAGQ